MLSTTAGALLNRLRHTLVPHLGAAATDACLLERFHTGRDEQAFEALVRRHGPMVLGVCRRVLGQEQDAEDAFQATFLVLARRSGSVRPASAVGRWLHGVAYHTALKARQAAARRRARERHAMERTAPAPADDLFEVRAILDQELSRLPNDYRAAVVLCDLEGLPRREAALQLGWPEGTVAGRLARARELLAGRLTQRGVAPSAAGLAAVLGQEAAGACAPTALVSATVKAILSESAPPAVTALAKTVLRATLLARLQAAALIVLVLGLGTVAWSVFGLQSTEPAAQAQTATSEGAQAKVDNPAEKKASRVFKAPGSYTLDVALSPDGKILARAGGDDGTPAGCTVELWDVASGKKLHTLRGYAFKVAFSPDGKTLASITGGWGPPAAAGPDGDGPGEVKLWDVATGKERWSVKGHRSRVVSLTFSADGKTLATASETVKFWDVATGKEKMELPVAYAALAFAPDGKTLAIAGDGVQLWDLTTGKKRASMPGHGIADSLSSLAFTPDGKTLVSAGLREPKEKGEEGPNRITKDPGGKSTSLEGYFCQLKVWDVATAKERTTIPISPIYSFPIPLVFTADGRTVMTAGWTSEKEGKGRVSVERWDLATSKKVATFVTPVNPGGNHPAAGHVAGIYFAALSADGKTVAWGGAEGAKDNYTGTAHVWEVGSLATSPPELPKEPKKSDPEGAKKPGEDKKPRMVTMGVIVLINAKTEGMSEGAKIKQIDAPKESVGKRDISNAHVTKGRASGQEGADQPRLNGTCVVKKCTVTLADGKVLENREVLFGIDFPPQALKKLRFVETVQAESDQGVGAWHAYDAADMQLPVPDDWDAHVAQANVIDALKKLGAAVKFPEESNENLAVEVSFTDVFATDAALKELAGLKRLRALNLHYFDPASTGPIPVTDAGLAELKVHTSLESLNLRRARVTDKGLKELKPLQALQALVLRETRITDVGLMEIKELQSLQVLDLGATRITDAGLKKLKGLKNLQTLNVDGTEVTAAGVKELQAALPGLKIGAPIKTDAEVKAAEDKADLAITRLGGAVVRADSHGNDDGIDPLVTTKPDPRAPRDPKKRIVAVSFYDSTVKAKDRKPVTDTGLKELELKELKNLRSLDLSRTQITDAGLKELKDLGSLRYLSLGNTKVTDAGLTELKDLKSLQLLGLANTRVTGAGLKELKSLSRLQTLALGHSGVTDAGMKGLKELKSLQSLDLSETQITDAGLKELKDLKSLSWMDLSRTELTDAGLKELAGFEGLQGLVLRETKVTDSGLKELPGLKNLHALYVGGTKVTAAGVKELQAALPKLKIEGGPGQKTERPQEKKQPLSSKATQPNDTEVMEPTPKDAPGSWVSLFNGKDLTGWKTHPVAPGDWRVEDGILIGRGPKVSHLYTDRGDYEDLHFRIEAKINAGGNSGQFFRKQFSAKIGGDGYEAQIDSSSHKAKTGSLYNHLGPAVAIEQVLVPVDTWFTQEVIVRGNHIVILVNGQKTVDFIDKNNNYARGHLALQVYDPATVVHFRKIEVKELGTAQKVVKRLALTILLLDAHTKGISKGIKRIEISDDKVVKRVRLADAAGNPSQLEWPQLKRQLGDTEITDPKRDWVVKSVKMTLADDEVVPGQVLSLSDTGRTIIELKPAGDGKSETLIRVDGLGKITSDKGKRTWYVYLAEYEEEVTEKLGVPFHKIEAKELVIAGDPGAIDE